MDKMSDKRDELLKAYQNLMAIKGECTSKVCGLYGIAEMTVKQINYLKIIDSCDNMTFSKLAEKTKITKPSVTDLINKLKDFGCVYKEQCKDDGREKSCQCGSAVKGNQPTGAWDIDRTQPVLLWQDFGLSSPEAASFAGGS